MTTMSLRARALACALLAGTIYGGLAATSAAAQSSPTFRTLDPNGVDLVTGDFLTSFPEGSIGSGEAELALLRMVGAIGSNGTRASSQWDHILFNLTPTAAYVDFGSRNDKFPGAESRGAALSGSGADYQYRSADGTVIAFADPSPGGDATYCDGSVQTSCVLFPTTITSPDGKAVNINYAFSSICIRQPLPENPDEEPAPPVCQNTARIASVTNSYGYEVRFAYASAPITSGTVPATFHQRTGASFYNANAGTSPLASVSYSYPSSGVTDITDTGGGVWRVTSSTSSHAVRRPGASSDTISASLSSGIVTSVTNGGVTASYSRSVSGSTATMTVTNALSQVSTFVSSLTTGRPTSVTDPLSRTIANQYDSSGRLTRTTSPEGNYTAHTYDTRGNVTQTETVPKSGSGLPSIVTTASYDSTCSNPLTCNQPNSTTDARGNVTDYTYSATHGGILTVTAPAPTSGATRPQTRYSYTLTNGEYRLTGTSTCQTGSSCTGTADEVVAAIGYDSSGNVTSTSTGNGAGTLTGASSMTYDNLGNLLTVDGPLSGTADTARMRYDDGRRVVGSVSPDPDGGGALKHRAVRNTYTNGLLTKAEQGNVNSQSDGDWAAFSSLQEVQTDYDANARPVVQRLVSGATTYALGQTSYDGLGRPECSAQRMNTAAFGSLPTSACTLGTSGSYGPDRIVKTFRDAAGQVTKTTSALGVTGVESDDVTATYSSNGLVQTVTDAENNKTTYVYDGHDRLSQIQYPSATKGAGTSNSGDYEQPTYENTGGGTRTSGTITAVRNRAGESIGFTANALGRVTAKDLPGSEPDLTYTYDLLGRTISASQSGNSLSFTYDALGRNLTQVGPHGTVTSTWDIVGRRTRVAHPDGFYVDQEYLVTGEPTAIRENGAASGAGVLATYAWDDLGRRASLTRGDGSVLSYGYDAVSRLTSLANNLVGTAYDQTLGFGYTPASQIASNTRSNDAYAWTGHYNLNRGYTANGRNQYTATGSITPTYDTKGNLTSAGATTYTYTSQNLLTSASGGIALAYDPAMRLYQTSGGSAGTTRFGYEGTDLIAEYNSSNAMLRRYVHGPGADAPLVWYEGSGTSDRRFLHADERGSVVAVTNSSGTTLNLNGYNEYGIPSSGNVGRFQYTGQTWLPELGMYYYKARIYSPTLGRFLQPDPIGYGAGMNMYAYVNGDPINFTDPSGLAGEECPGSLSTSCGNDDKIIGYSARQYVDEYFKGVTSAVRDELIEYVEEFLSGTLNQDGLEKAIRGELPGWWDFRFADQVNDIIVTGQQTANLFTDVFSFSGDLRRLGDFWGGGECGCLEAGTLVATPRGLVPIETIKVGDLVISFNEATGEQAPRHVTDIIRPNPKSLYALATVDASGRADLFHATDDHPWKVVGKGWVETINLTAGDRVATGGGQPLTVVSLTDSGRNERTYNLTVAQWHTFMIGEKRAVVHNACPPLRLLHPIETLTSGSSQFSFEFWKSQATDFIVESLSPDTDFPLLVDAAGLIWDGNTRISILKERRYPVDELPRTPK